MNERPQDNPPLLEVRALRKSYGSVRALGGVGLRVGAAEITGLIGPNGSGKTTLFNCMTGFARVDGGEVSWRGREVTGTPTYRLSRLGMVRTFQNVMVFPELTLRDSLACAKHAHGVRGLGVHANPEVDTDSEALLRAAGLHGVADRVVGSLPYGLQRLTNVVMAASLQPWLLMLDEPAAGLDSGEADALAQFVGALKSMGTSVLLIDHNMPLISRLCEHVYVIDAGSNLMAGTPAEVMCDPRVLEVYLGSTPEERAGPAEA